MGKMLMIILQKAKNLYLIGDKRVLDKFPKNTKEAIALFSPVKKMLLSLLVEKKSTLVEKKT